MKKKIEIEERISRVKELILETLKGINANLKLKEEKEARSGLQKLKGYQGQLKALEWVLNAH